MPAIKRSWIAQQRVAIQIEELSKADEKLQLDIFDVKDLARNIFKELSKRITAIEDKEIKKGVSASKHLDQLFADMEIIGRKQVSFLEASKVIGKSRMKQLKPNIAHDGRFIIVKSRSHKQKEMIRLRKYHNLIK